MSSPTRLRTRRWRFDTQDGHGRHGGCNIVGRLNSVDSGGLENKATTVGSSEEESTRAPSCSSVMKTHVFSAGGTHERSYGIKEVRVGIVDKYRGRQRQPAGWGVLTRPVPTLLCETATAGNRCIAEMAHSIATGRQTISERRQQLIMNENNQRTSTGDRSRACCHYCGMSVNLGSEDAVMDAPGGSSPDHKSGVEVWHRRCFDDFLDEGEET